MSDFSQLEILDYCPNCDEPLYHNLAARPPARFSLMAILVIVGAITIWPILTFIALGVLRPRSGFQILGSLFGITAMSASVGAWALRMPRVRSYRCRECGWKGFIRTNWRR